MQHKIWILINWLKITENDLRQFKNTKTAFDELGKYLITDMSYKLNEFSQKRLGKSQSALTCSDITLLVAGSTYSSSTSRSIQALVSF